MCNLSEGIWDAGREKGREEGAIERTDFMIANMLKRGDKPEDAAAIADVSIQYVQKIAAKLRRGEL